VAGVLRLAVAQLRATSPTPQLDAELLLAEALGLSRLWLVAEQRAPVPPSALVAFHAAVARRLAGEPVAYIIGRRSFAGIALQVDHRVLVPRPETETLVELACAEAHRLAGGALEIADIGTGSGAIAIALALALPRAHVFACDLSTDALALAQCNVASHGLAGRVVLLAGDLLAPLPRRVPLLVSNPPYTVMSENEPAVNRFEPTLALDGGADGLACLRRIIAQLPAALLPTASVLLEIGATQAQAVVRILADVFPAAAVSVHRDLAGRDRVVRLRCVGPPAAHRRSPE
jgi:release factor glutamine methyltransferase